MNMWDKVLPHRFFIHHALRTASDELRNHIDSYRIEHEMAVQRCHNEIEAAKAEKDRQFELLKQGYRNELARDSYALGELQKLFLDYVDAYTKKELLNLSKEKIQLELQLLNEYGNFLTAQMQLIGEEIAILERRQEVLSLQVKIDDIVALIGITGADLSCDDSDNSKILFEKVNSILFENNDLLPQTKAALFKLRKLLQERAEYLPLIQYISWLIQQKKSFSRDLSRERREVNESKKPLKDQLLVIKTELQQLDASIPNNAIRIRNVWAEPLADICVKLAVTSKSLDKEYERQNSIREELQTMKREHSSDSNRWNQLQAEREEVYEDIGQLKGRQAKLREQRQQWLNRKRIICNLFKKNRVILLSPDGDRIFDEVRILQSRRKEIDKQIEDANCSCNARSAQLANEYYPRKNLIASQIQAAQKAVSEKKQRLVEAEERVKKLKEQDTRSFFERLFSESKEVINARARRDEVQNELKKAEQNLENLQKRSKRAKDNYQNDLRQLKEQYKSIIDTYQEKASDINRAITLVQKR